MAPRKKRRTPRDPSTRDREDPAYSGEYGAPPKLPKRKARKR